MTHGFPKEKSQRSIELQISTVITQDGEGFYAYVPAFKGLHVDGSTEQEVKEHVVEAIAVYLESLIEHGDPLPIGPHLTVHEKTTYEVPPGAFLQHITMPWPRLNTSGISWV